MNQKDETPVTQRARRMAYRFVGIQAAVALVVAIGWLFSSVSAFESTVLGGLAVVLPSSLFAKQLFKTTSARAARKIVVAFYVGETVKIFLSASLAVIFICFVPLKMVPFWSGFIAALMGFWIAPAFIRMDVT